jgi:hypothetical protein
MDIEQTPDILADAGFFYTGILICSNKILNRTKPLLIKITVLYCVGTASRLVFINVCVTYRLFSVGLYKCSLLPIYSTFNDKKI